MPTLSVKPAINQGEIFLNSIIFLSVLINQDPPSQNNSQDRRGTRSPRKQSSNQSPHSPQNYRSSPESKKTKEPKSQENE